jgi:UDP-2,3-diacylglucosamine hydrolase
MPRGAARGGKAAAPPPAAAPEASAPSPAAAAPGRHGLPALFEYAAPSSWRAVDFVSDMHLCASRPRTVEAFAAYLQQTPADAVFILGDLFELWVGDDARTRPFERHCCNVLAEAASRRQVGLMVGNRDFLIGTTLLRETGMMGLPDPTVLAVWGQRVLLTHGDSLCLADLPYQAFRREVRSAEWQQRFLSRPLAERLALAADIRRASQARRQFDGSADADVDAAEAVRWMHALGTVQMVHGHTHRPGSAELAPGFKRHVLSDWDLDEASRAEVLRLTRDGFQRLPLATPAAPAASR